MKTNDGVEKYCMQFYFSNFFNSTFSYFKKKYKNQIPGDIFFCKIVKINIVFNNI